MQRSTMGIRAKLLMGFLSISFVVLVAGILGVLLINTLKENSWDVGVHNAPLGDAAMEIKLHATTAHLIFEEIMGGDTEEDVTEVWSLLDETLWYANAILKGGKNEEGEFFATESDEVKAKIREVIADVELFKKSAQTRYELLSLSQGIGSAVDQEFDKKYDSMQDELGALQEEYSTAKYIKLVKLIGDTRYYLANGHLFLEEFLSGDAEIDFEDITANFSAAHDNIHQMQGTIGHYRTRAVMKDMDDFLALVKQRHENVNKAMGAGSKADEDFDEIYHHFMIEADEAEELIHEYMDHGVERMLFSANVGRMVLVVSIGISFILALLIGLFLSTSISKALGNISTTLQSSSGQIASAAFQLSGSAEQIASGATEQASSIEETTASIEELTSMVKQNVGNAREASTLSGKARETSETGYNEMQNMVNSMTDITNSSEEIRNVIKVIDDIAFQTNILALNAAVEAARAGEAGMGFAVVADEVKNLANKSAEAAKETAQMIENSIKKSQTGFDITNKLVEVFKEMLGSSQKVNEVAKEVEIASDEQDKGLEQVSRAIIQLDKVVQENAASAEETAGSAEELSTQAEIVKGLVADLIRVVKGNTGNIEYQTTTMTGVDVRRDTQARAKKRKQQVQANKQLENKAVERGPESVIPFEDDEEFVEK